MSSYMALAAVVFTLFKSSYSACHGARTSYRAEFIGKLALDNHVLLDHVLAKPPVTSFTECLGLCRKDCRCRSVNLPVSGRGECELNSEDNNTVLLAPRRGWRYHHFQVLGFHPGADTCYEPYSNGCCSSNPCLSGAACTDVGDRGKPGFNCSCVQGYTGPLCERKIHSCLDYLWNDKDAVSGYYDIWDKSTGSKSRVYCEMRPGELEAWTLVMSHTYANRGNYGNQPFYDNFTRNEIDAGSGDYRLSLSKMQSIRSGMERDGRVIEWKSTCNFDFANGNSTSDDTVRSTFDTIDIMRLKTLANHCLRVHYIKIRGRDCYDCNVWVSQTDSEIFSINAYRGDQSCNFNSASTVRDEKIFGGYNKIDALTHACVRSSSSTTQYWFGGRLKF